MEVVQWGNSYSNSVVSFFNSLALSTSSFPARLYLASLSLTRPVSLSCLHGVNRGEKEVRAWQVLPRITRDINFTFQSLLLARSFAPSLSLFVSVWISNIGRKKLLLGTRFSSFWAVMDRLTGSTNFTHTRTHSVKKGRPTVFSATVCITLPWSCFIQLPRSHPKSSYGAQGGAQNSRTQLAVVKCLGML